MLKAKTVARWRMDVPERKVDSARILQGEDDYVKRITGIGGKIKPVADGVGQRVRSTLN
jgi:hypothetical protein